MMSPRSCGDCGGDGAVVETGKPVVDMTKTEYILTWVLALAVGLFLARYVLVQPILDALAK